MLRVIDAIVKTVITERAIITYSDNELYSYSSLEDNETEVIIDDIQILEVKNETVVTDEELNWPEVTFNKKKEEDL